MQYINTITRLFDSKLVNISEKRLRRLLDSQYPQFEYFSELEHKLCLAEHVKRIAEGKVGKTPLRATKSIMAATLGVKLFSCIDKQRFSVDEDLELAQFDERRLQQVTLLYTYIKEQSCFLEYPHPEPLFTMCEDFIALWQPTICTPDEYPEALLRALQAKAKGELPHWFQRVGPKLKAAINEPKLSTKKTVCEALALLKIGDESSLTSNIWYSLDWRLMREHLGIIAVDLANTGGNAKSILSINALKSLWESGIIYAGVQIARMYFDLISPKRLNKLRAEEIIDQTYAQYLSEQPNSFDIPMLKASEVELYRVYNIIKFDALSHAVTALDIQRLTKQIIEAALAAASLRFDGFAAVVLSILVPEFPPMQDSGNESFFELRQKISKYPKAEAYCHQMAKSAEVIALKQRNWG